MSENDTKPVPVDESKPVETAPHRRTFTLPSGKVVAVLKEPKGTHLVKAERLTGNANDKFSLTCAVASITCKFDGVDMVYEDVLALGMHDVLMLTGEILGKGGT